MKVVLNAKIHRAWVTGTNTEYVGSVIIDSALMDRVGMWEYEKVLLCNVTNGARWETYAIAGEPESGTISVQGAGARLCEIGDCLVILSFDVTRQAGQAKDDHGRPGQQVHRVPGGHTRE